MCRTVDVVLCTNKRSPFLPEALASLRAQTYPHWTLTLVDDSSGEQEWLEEQIADLPSAILVRGSARPGLPAARNIGIAAGRGEFVTFLDDDDVWRADRLEMLVDALNADSAAIAAASAGWHLDSAGGEDGSGWAAPESSTQEYLRGAVPFPRIVALVVRRSALAAIGPFDESFSLGEDNEFIVRLLASGAVATVPSRLVGYRRHPGAMMNARRALQREADLRLLGMHIARLSSSAPKFGELLRENRRAYVRRAASDAVAPALRQIASGAFADGFRDLWWGTRHAPVTVAGVVFARVPLALFARQRRHSRTTEM